MDARTTDRRRPEGPGRLFMVLVMLGLILAHTADAQAQESDWQDRSEARADVSLTVEAGDADHRATYLVLQSSADEKWFSDRPEFIGYGAARSPVVDAALPEPLEQWRGEDVRIWNREGEDCRANVDELYGLSRASALPTTKARWKGEHPGVDADPLGEREIADKLWEFPGPVANEVDLVARLDLEGGCDLDEPRWGHRADRDATALVPTKLTDRERRELRFEFRATDEFADIQQRFEDRRPDDGGLWTDIPHASPTVEAFHSREHDRTFAVVRADAGPGCGDFGGRTWALFELEYRGADLRIHRHESFARHPTAVTMADPGIEGRPVLVNAIHPWGSPPGHQLVVPGDDHWNSTSTARINAEHACAC